MKEASRDRAMPLFVADGIYLAAVYAFFLAIPPLGRDYAALARPDSVVFFDGMTRLFGAHGWMYLLVNFALLYGCVALILALARNLTDGPWWLGSVAAVLFMANPVKTEAVLNLSGVRDLWPCFMALLTIYVYLVCRESNLRGAGLAPLFVYLIAVLTGPLNITLFAVLMALEFFVFEKRTQRWLPIAVAGAIALFASGQWAIAGALGPARMFAPLFFIIYPIGMTPDTVAFFQAWPLAGYAVGIAAVVVCLYLIRKVNNPAFTFGLLGAAAFRLCQGGFTVDAVTLAGGGRLLVPAALVCIAVAGFFRAVMENVEWRKSVVRITTLLCIAAMICQLWVNLHWRHAGREMQRLQALVAEAALENPGEPIAIVPDIQYYRTVPLMLCESVKYRTPFSAPQPVVPLMPISVIPPVDINIKRYSPESVTVSVQGLAAPAEDKPPLFSRRWWLRRYQPTPPVILHIESAVYPFPSRHLSLWQDVPGSDGSD
ncbi:MAG TPA: hypothetical protein ENN29_07070 [Candidatus Hydrogenedentes bacterium]|nr:hypothetical protein [Candidatus Hydrogenedentota bacterium]